MSKLQFTKHRIKLSFIIYFSLTFISCQQKQEQIEATTIFVELPTDKQSVDSLFSNIELIRLDTINGGIVNFASDVECMNNSIYITQMSTDEVFSYDLSGKFNFKISSKGGANNEYNNIGDFIVDPFSNTLLILDHTDYHRYDTLGNFINNVETNIKDEGHIRTVVPYSLDKYICVLDLKWSSNYKMFSENDKSVNSAFSDPLPINVKSPFYRFNNQIYNYKWYNNTVYKVGDDMSLTPHYIFDFKGDTDISTPSSITNDNEFEDLTFKKGICFFEIQENDRYILIDIIQTISGKPSKETLVYDKVRKQSFNIDNFSENISIGRSLKLTEDGYIIGIVSIEDLKNSIAVKLLDVASQKIYNQISELDNPVIVKSKLRY